MLKPQPYYYEDIIFQLELNLQTIRRELISFLEEYRDKDCDVCNRIKCQCIEKNNTLKEFFLFDINDDIDRDTIYFEKNAEKQKFENFNNINLQCNKIKEKVSKTKLILTYNNLSVNDTNENTTDTGVMTAQILLNGMFEAARRNNHTIVQNIPNIDTIFDNQNILINKDVNIKSKSLSTKNRFEEFTIKRVQCEYLNKINKIPPAANTLPNPQWNSYTKNQTSKIENVSTSNSWAEESVATEISQIRHNSKKILNEMNYTWPPVPKSIWSCEKANKSEKEMVHRYDSDKVSNSVDVFFKHFQSKNIGRWTGIP